MPRERRSSVQLKSYYDEHISSFHKEPFNFIADDGNAETTFRPRGWMRKRLGWILSIGLIVMIITTGYAVNTRTTRESDSDSEIDNIITSESIRVPANESNLVVSHGSTIPDLGWNATIHESLLHHVRELNESDQRLRSEIYDRRMSGEEEVNDSEKCGTGEWQRKYRGLHREILNGSRPARILQSFCGPNRRNRPCGGFADRIIGFVSTALYAILSDRAISIDWTNPPINIPLLFDAPNVDWSVPFDANDLSNHSIYGNPSLIEQREKRDTLGWNRVMLHDYFAKFTEWTAPWLRLEMNRGVVYGSFNYPEVSPLLEQIGFKSSTAFSCLLDYLIKPKHIIMTHVNAYSSFFSLPSVYSIGIQIRTGDAAMSSPEADRNNTVQVYQHYFTCAEQVADRYALDSQRVVFYLISDSHHLKQNAVDVFGSKVIISGLEASHISETNRETSLYNTIAEVWTFARTDFHILTQRSGFGKIASWMKAQPNSTIALLRTPTHGRVVDCSSDRALTSDFELASRWSLG